MDRNTVEAAVSRLPFVPFRVHAADGRQVDVLFPEMARVLSAGLLIFIGMKEGSRLAQSFVDLAYSNIDRIEDRPEIGRSKKAS
jgi:hypothetical protein